MQINRKCGWFKTTAQKDEKYVKILQKNDNTTQRSTKWHSYAKIECINAAYYNTSNCNDHLGTWLYRFFTMFCQIFLPDLFLFLLCHDFVVLFWRIIISFSHVIFLSSCLVLMQYYVIHGINLRNPQYCTRRDFIWWMRKNKCNNIS